MKKVIYVFTAFVLILCGLCSCKHEHIFSDPTCTSPATCEKCGEIRGESLGHTWNDATCVEPKTCSFCGLTEGNVSENHNWIESTCTEAKHCNVCGIVEGDALGHTWIDATCTIPKYCSRCNLQEGKENGHNVENWKIETKETCISNGEEIGKCSNCGENIHREIPKLGHDDGKEVISQKATWNVPGIKEVRCTRCNEIISSDKYVLEGEEKVKSFKSECESVKFDDLNRYPDDYENKMIKVKCKVLQVVDEDTETIGFRADMTKGKYYWDDDVMIIYLREEGKEKLRILEDDVVTVYGLAEGLYSYTTVMGATRTVPLIYAYYIEM